MSCWPRNDEEISPPYKWRVCGYRLNKDLSFEWFSEETDGRDSTVKDERELASHALLEALYNEH